MTIDQERTMFSLRKCYHLRSYQLSQMQQETITISHTIWEKDIIFVDTVSS